MIDNSSSTRGMERKNRVAILSIGTRLHEALVAAQEVEDEYEDLSITVADARFMKPLDVNLVRQLADDNGVLITIEEGSAGGFSAHVMKYLANEGLLDNGLKVRNMTMPDEFIEQDNPAKQLDKAGLTSRHIVKHVLCALGRDAETPTLTETQRA